MAQIYAIIGFITIAGVSTLFWWLMQPKQLTPEEDPIEKERNALWNLYVPFRHTFPSLMYLKTEPNIPEVLLIKLYQFIADFIKPYAEICAITYPPIDVITTSRELINKTAEAFIAEIKAEKVSFDEHRETIDRINATVQAKSIETSALALANEISLNAKTYLVLQKPTTKETIYKYYRM